MNITKQDVLVSAWQSAVLAALLIIALIGSFLAVEPTVGRAVFDQFTVTQDVTAEISFLTAAADVTLASIPGITGGTSNGSTYVRVLTNNAAGYNMTIAASSSPAMQGEATTGEIPNYTPAVAGVPDFSHSVGANTGEFAYTVSASNTADLAQKFLDNGSNACNTGSADTDGSDTCWYALFTSATSTINRTTATPSSGATTTIFFRTQITSSPVPAIPEDSYNATTTLTAVVNP